MMFSLLIKTAFFLLAWPRLLVALFFCKTCAFRPPIHTALETPG